MTENLVVAECRLRKKNRTKPTIQRNQSRKDQIENNMFACTVYVYMYIYFYDEMFWSDARLIKVMDTRIKQKTRNKHNT